MATFNKRGYKAPKPKAEQEEPVFVNEPVSTVDDTDSVTAKTFGALDETASKTEEFVEKNRKAIFAVLSIIVIGVLSYMLYDRFLVEPKEEEAATAIFSVQTNFQKALEADGVKADSLFKVVLKGNRDGKGAIAVAADFSGTSAANLAHYYAGIAYLNTAKFDQAIEELSAFKSSETFTKASSIGAIGDAYSEKKMYDKALEQYLSASEVTKNDFTTPRFLLKAGKVALTLNKKADALKYFQRIKDEFESSPEAQNIDPLIILAQ